MKRFFWLILICLYCDYCNAQQAKIDSIKRSLSSTKQDTARVKLYDQLSNYYREIKIDSSSFYNLAAIDLSKKLEYQKGLAQAFFRQSRIESTKGELSNSINWLDSCIVIRRAQGDISGELSALAELGAKHDYLGHNNIAIEIYNKGLAKAKSHDIEINIMQFRSYLGQFYNKLQNFDSALFHLGEVYKLVKAKPNPAWQMFISELVGTVHWRKQDHLLAFKYYREGLDIAIEEEAVGRINKLSSNIAMIYNDIGMQENAIKIWLSLVDDYRDGGQVMEEGYVLRHLATTYRDLEDFDNAINYSLKAIERLDSSPDKLVIPYSIMSFSYLESGNLQLAQVNALKSLQLAQEYDDTQHQALAKAHMAGVALKSGDYQDAKRLFLESLSILDFVFPITANYIHTNLALTFQELEEFDKGYYHLDQALAYRDSMITESEAKTLVRSTIEFETEKKERALLEAQKETQIQLLELEKKELQIARTNFIVAVVAILSLTLGFIVFLINSRKRLKLKTEAVLSQQKSLRLQMNPHFIFNALASIQDYMNEVNIEKANDYLIKFGRLMRQTLENSRTEFIPVTNEIESIKDYLELQSLHHNMGFDYEVNHDFKEVLEDYYLPPMFVQPFVENAIEHGISNLENGKITVLFSHLENEVRIIISDSGNQQDANRYVMKSEFEPLAKKIIEERIYHLNRLEHTNARLDISAEGDGTKVILILPLREY